MDDNAFEFLKRVQKTSFENYSSNTHLPSKNIGSDIQNVKDEKFSDMRNVQKNKELQQSQELLNISKDVISSKDSVIKNNYIPALCISKKEYENIVNKRPLIKFRPIRNSMVKSFDKKLLAEALEIPLEDVDTVIKQTTEYLTYMNPSSIYYDPTQIKYDMYMLDRCKKNILERQMAYSIDTESQEYLYYKEQGDIIGPYVYRHGTKDELLGYMKYQLSEAKSALKQLYNILDTECGGLYSYFERPIHVLDNRTVKKMHKIITNGLNEAKNQGYITHDFYNQTVEWALDKIYAIQSDTSLREALKTVIRNS